MTNAAEKHTATTPARRAGWGLFLLVALVYLPAWSCDFIWDDDDYILENVSLRSLAGLKQIWINPQATPQYYPLVHTGFWLEYHLWGLHPAGYHGVNLLLHACGCVLLWRILERLQIPGAWWAAAVFGFEFRNIAKSDQITETIIIV